VRYPSAVGEIRRANIRARRPVPTIRASLIRNGRMDAGRASTNRRTLSIVQRAVDCHKRLYDAVRIWLNTERDGVSFRTAYIGADFTVPYAKPFDSAALLWFRQSACRLSLVNSLHSVVEGAKVRIWSPCNTGISLASAPT
jgi:hypothetical protein